MKTLETLFLDELADMYDAENRLTKALPKLAKAATHSELREAFETHLNETEGHVTKLEKVFQSFGKPARGKKCEAIVGLLKEGDEIKSDNKSSPTINAALISAAQKVEHYEIASYGCLREWAEQLGNDQAAEVLQTILDEEKSADQKLTEVARYRCNESAQKGDLDQNDSYSQPPDPAGSGLVALRREPEREQAKPCGPEIRATGQIEKRAMKQSRLKKKEEPASKSRQRAWIHELADAHASGGKNVRVAAETNSCGFSKRI